MAQPQTPEPSRAAGKGDYKEKGGEFLVDFVKEVVRAKVAEFRLVPSGKTEEETAKFFCDKVKADLKDFLAKAYKYKEHRTKLLQFEKGYELTQDVLNQVRQLHVIERIAEKRNAESQVQDSEDDNNGTPAPREKPPSKRPKRVKNVEADLADTNQTALLAIGTRKKANNLENSIQGDAGANALALRIRNANMKLDVIDLIHVLENEKQFARSPFLYKLMALHYNNPKPHDEVAPDQTN